MIFNSLTQRLVYSEYRKFVNLRRWSIKPEIIARSIRKIISPHQKMKELHVGRGGPALAEKEPISFEFEQ